MGNHSFRKYPDPDPLPPTVKDTPVDTRTAILNAIDVKLTKLWVQHMLGKNRGEDRSYRPFDKVLDERLEAMGDAK